MKFLDPMKPRGFVIIVLLALMQWTSGDTDDERLSGGDTTIFEENNKAFSRPLANIQATTLRQHSIGNSFFNQNWIEAPASATARDGLGPLFNARSCSACHPHDGKGSPHTRGVNKLGMVTRISIPGTGPRGEPLGDPTYGTQLADFALSSGQPEATLRLNFHKEQIFLAGRPFLLHRPELRVRDLAFGPLNDEVLFSNRLAPAVFGMGLINEVADETILSFADPGDRDGDGISGRPNLVWDREAKKKRIGRFGWKASQPTLKQQIGDAFVNDIGITSSLFPHEAIPPAQALMMEGFEESSGGSPEVSDRVLDRVTTYLATIAPPARRGVDKDSVQEGKKLFHRIQCAACHIPEMKTRANASLPELSEQTIRPFSDFLLHDMGPGLADGRPDFEASGREWRTPPLWGIGLQHVVSRHSFFLHDGRARNVIEAILWHGGEGQKSRDLFVALPQKDKEAIFDFLNSL